MLNDTVLNNLITTTAAQQLQQHTYNIGFQQKMTNC